MRWYPRPHPHPPPTQVVDELNACFHSAETKQDLKPTPVALPYYTQYIHIVIHARKNKTKKGCRRGGCMLQFSNDEAGSQSTPVTLSYYTQDHRRCRTTYDVYISIHINTCISTLMCWCADTYLYIVLCVILYVMLLHARLPETSPL